MMPKVSIIVPIYNVQEYLRECLDSLLSQTLQEIEIICVNDGSTDHSPEILESYATLDARVKVMHKENSGYGASMNQGIRAASGEYIGIVEPDDYVETEMYEELYRQAKEFQLDWIIYLAVRLAISELFFPEEPVPLIFDDAFALYDDHRLAKTLSYLYNFSNAKSQVFIFTCHKREQQVIEQLHIPYGIISLDIIPR